MTQPVIVLFGNDLRLADHPALTAAQRSGVPVLPLYVLDDADAGTFVPGGASRWWLHHSLTALSAALARLGSRLILRRGPLAATVAALVQETGATGVFFSRRYEPQARRAENDLMTALAANGATAHRYAGSLLAEPEALLTASATPYRVFTPFANAFRARGEPEPPLPATERLAAPSDWPKSDLLAAWQLTPRAPDWAEHLGDHWRPGEDGARMALDRFFNGTASAYGSDRDRPSRRSTSRLSAHLHFGEISPCSLWHRTRLMEARDGIDATPFLRQVLWREFSYHLLHHFPSLVDKPFRPEFAAFPWADDAPALQRWQRGQTGYPIVDAGMRELWVTGWMHNRVRMIAASFLVKDLLIPWQAGAAWFWDTLVDADLANNAAGWQWVAGSGADAAPYFRVFNPVLQGRKFDPDGAYVRRWLPEIAALPDRYIHAPWEAPADILRFGGVDLGTTYPAPMVDHARARQRALDAFRRLARNEPA